MYLGMTSSKKSAVAGDTSDGLIMAQLPRQQTVALTTNSYLDNKQLPRQQTVT